MPRTPNNPAYNWLAQYYDLLFTPFRTPIDAAREHVLEPILPRVTCACDLACGTGTTALALARQGIRMYAVDRSPVMRRLAREKVRREGQPVRVLGGDMRDFRLPERVDLILCEYDAVNHVPKKSDLRKVTKAVARALEPGGYFYFDVNNRLGFERGWSGIFMVERPGVVVVMRNSNDAARDRAWAEIEWFIQEGSLWRRHRERVDEVCWSADEISRALRDAGFDRVRSWDATPFFKGNRLVSAGCRTVYLARHARQTSN